MQPLLQPVLQPTRRTVGHETAPMFQRPSALASVPPDVPLRRCPSISPPRDGDERFIALLGVYRGFAGLARAGDVITLLEQRNGSGVGTLARWIVDEWVISIEWQADTWLPLFQFNAADMSPRPEVAQVIAELAGAFDPWERAEWFVQPNPSLGERAPAECLMSDPGAGPTAAPMPNLQAVLNAARADRFVAVG